MKTKLKTRSQSRPAELIVYMEVYSSNRVVYRVTAGSIVRRGSGSPPMESCWRTCTPKNARAFPTFPAVWNRRSALPMT